MIDDSRSYTSTILDWTDLYCTITAVEEFKILVQCFRYVFDVLRIKFNELLNVIIIMIVLASKISYLSYAF